MEEQAIKQTLPQRQKLQSGIELVMIPSPQSHADRCVGSGMLEGKVALITGGDSAIGRAVAVAFAKEGADVAFIYLEARGKAMKTADAVEAVGRQCLRIAANVGDEALCRDAIQEVIERFGRLDILVNAAEQQPAEKLEDLTEASCWDVPVERILDVLSDESGASLP
jgi:NAD(P)-dependent dehydrogenase (short-subunit alcohol dehydrogenase family)